MVLLHIVDQIIGGRGRRTIEVEAKTVGEAVAQCGLDDPFVLLGAQVVHDLDVTIPEGMDVTVGPQVGDPVTVLAVLAINIVAGLTSYYLTKQAVSTALGSRQDQGDDASPTYAWNNALSTTYGPGHSIIVLGGTHRIGGNAVDVLSEPSAIAPDVLRLRIQLCEGPIHAIGGVSPSFGEADKLGTLDGTISDYAPIPAGLKLNDVLLDSRGTEVAIRLGHPHQSRLPHWPATATTLPVGAQLEEVNQTFTFAIAEQNVDSIVVAVNFPNGLYQLSGSQRQPYPVRLLWEVRRQGGAWSATPYHDVLDFRATAFTSYHRIVLPVTRSGPYEIRATRLTQRGDQSTVVSSASWIWARHELAQAFTLAGRAALELSVVASERQVDQSPNVTVPASGCLVRAWDPTTGWTDRRWTSSPFVYPIGSNPAWFLTHILLDDELGLGPRIKRILGGQGDEEVSLRRMLDWAVFCDQDDPDDPGKPMHRVDIVLDTQSAPLDQVLQILRCGRGAPVFDGGQFWVTYEWTAAHSRGSYSVPARAPVQVITSSQVESFELRWLDTSGLPGRLHFQFADEARDWQPDEVPILDTDRTLTGEGEAAPRITEDTISLRGITRRHAVRREGWWLLRWNKLSRAEVAITAGLQQISVTGGDLVWVVHECWWPSPTEPNSSCHTLTEAPVGVSSIVLDADLDVRGAARVGTGVFVMRPDGVAQLATVDLAGPVTIAAGDPVPLWDPSAGGGTGAPASVTCTAGAVVATGTYGTFRRKFRVTEVKQAPNYKVSLRAVLWDEAMFAAPPPEAMTDWGTSDIGSLDVVPALPSPIGAPQVPVVGVGAGVVASTDRISWTATEDRRGDRARVYVRPRGGGPWALAGESTTTELPVDQIPVGIEHEVVVLYPTPGGAYASPAEIDPVVIRLAEASGPTPLQVARLSAVGHHERLAAQWDRVTDAATYEVRRGASWDGPQVAETIEPRLHVDFPEEGEHRLRVRARSTRARLGEEHEIAVTVAHPLGTVEQVDDIPAAGTHDGTQWSGTDSAIELQAGMVAGTYTTPELDAGKLLDLRWGALIDWTLLAADQVGELAGLQVGELGLVGAPIRPSRVRPGLSGHPISGLSGVLVGEIGSMRTDQIGPRASALIEQRFHDGSSWGAWSRYRAQRRTAQRMQVRLVITRADARVRLLVDRLLLSCTP